MTITESLKTFRDADLTILQAMILLYVCENGPTKNNTLNENFDAPCCRSLNQMQAKGYVRQRADKTWRSTAKGDVIAGKFIVPMPT